MQQASHQWMARLGLRYPLIQAPMAGVATPQLAAAVSSAGGLGSLGIGPTPVATARQMIADTQALTSQPININVFCHAPVQRDTTRETAWLQHLAPLFAEAGITPPATLREIYRSFIEDNSVLESLLALRPAVVSFHFGLPGPDQLQALQAAGIYTMASATSLEEAIRIEQAGIDAIIAQGIEAGGHRGMFDPAAPDAQLGTMALVRLLVHHTRLPVIAAGGIMDGNGIHAVLEMGAVAAQLGTAFICCPESAATPAYRANLLSARAHDTRLTSALSGRPARGITNRLMLHGDNGPAPAPYPVAYDAAIQLHAAAAKADNHAFAAHWAGQGAPLSRALPAATLVDTLVREWQSAAAGMPAPGQPGR